MIPYPEFPWASAGSPDEEHVYHGHDLDFTWSPELFREEDSTEVNDIIYYIVVGLSHHSEPKIASGTPARCPVITNEHYL